MPHAYLAVHYVAGIGCVQPRAVVGGEKVCLCVLCRGGIRQREWRDTHTFGMLRFCWCGGLGFVGVFGLFVWGYVKNQVK